MAKERPGLMVYFDLLEPLEELSTDEIGEFMLAMLYYGRDGIEPDFSGNGMLRMLWKTEKPRCDRGKEKYFDTIEARKYAAFCREYAKQNGKEAVPPSLEEWKRNQMNSPDIKCNEQERKQEPEQERNDTYIESENGEKEISKREGTDLSREKPLDSSVAELVQAFKYAYKNSMLGKAVQIRQELAMRGFSPDGEPL